MWGNAISVCLGIVGVANRCSEGVACWEDSLFGVLEGLSFVLLAEEWLLHIWSEINDIGHWRSKIVPSFGGQTTLRTMIFITRLQKGRHILVANQPAVFPLVWNMWAQMST